MTTYTHAVVHRVPYTKEGKTLPTDELIYAVDVNHAYAIAHQGLAVGWSNVTIIQLKEPTTVSEPHEPTNNSDQHDQNSDQPSVPTSSTNTSDQQSLPTSDTNLNDQHS